MKKRIPFEEIYSGILVIFCGIFPIAPKLTAPILILYSFFWLLEGNFRTRFDVVLKEKFRLWLIVPTIFYSIHVIGMVYSENVDFGLFDLQVKLPLLILPILFSTAPAKLLSKAKVNRYFIAFVFGSLIYAIYVLSLSCYQYFTTSNCSNEIFLYSTLSRHIHPSYAALFTVISITFCCYLYKNGLKTVYLKIAAFFLSLFVIMLSSKAGFVSLFFCFLFCFFQLFKQIEISKTKLFFSIFIGILFLGMLFYFIKNVPYIYNRYAKIIPALKGAEEGDASTNIRLKIWKVTTDLIPQYFWIGTGTGDVKDVLVAEYDHRNMTSFAKEKYNSHSQIFQSFLALGILGFVSLLAFLITPLWIGIKNKYFLLSFFSMMAVTNCLVESMLEGQAGVMFFTFFYCILIMHSFYLKQKG